MMGAIMMDDFFDGIRDMGGRALDGLKDVYRNNKTTI